MEEKVPLIPTSLSPGIFRLENVLSYVVQSESICRLKAYFYWIGAAVCIGCQQGTFASNNGSSECLACPLGHFNDIDSARNCSSCWSETQGVCEPIAISKCTRCNSLRFRANPSKIPGEYLCRYGNGPVFPEFECFIPDPNMTHKISCDYEASLFCSAQQPYEISNIELNCQPQFFMEPWSNSQHQRSCRFVLLRVTFPRTQTCIWSF